MQISTANSLPFVYPTIDHFPTDKVCSEIVRALEKRQWIFPGIDVEFYINPEPCPYMQVTEIKGKEFKIFF